jgi:mRNA interferase MazF
MQNLIRRGQIWICDLPDMGGSIQKFKRPMLVISNNLANLHSPVIHLCPISSKTAKSNFPTHVKIGMDSGLNLPSIALVEQSMLLSKSSLINKVAECSEGVMDAVDRAIGIQFGIVQKNNNMQYA